MRRRSTACILSVAIVAALCGCATADNSPTQEIPTTTNAPLAKHVPQQFKNSTITVTTGANNPPLYLNDRASAPAGLTHDVAAAAAELLGVELDIRVSGFDTVIPELQTGTLDMGIYGIDVLPERVKRIDMVSYFEGGHHVVTYDQRLQLTNSFNSLCGLTLGGIAGSAWVQTISDISTFVCTPEQPITMQEFRDQSGANAAAKEGTVDGAVIANIAGEYLTATDPQWSITGPNIAVTPVGMAFTKGSGLAEAFTVAINELVKNGTYDEIFREYGVANLELDQAELNPR